MIGNLLTSFEKKNGKYIPTTNSKAIIATMDLFVNKFILDNSNIKTVYNDWLNKEDFSMINPKDLPYILLDIGFYCKDQMEVRDKLSLIYDELSIDSNDSNLMYHDCLMVACLINLLKKGSDKELAELFYNLNGDNLNNKTKEAVELFLSSSSFDELYKKKDEINDYYITGIALSMLELYYKYIDNKILTSFYDDVEYDKFDDYYQVMHEYLFERLYGMVNQEGHNVYVLVSKFTDINHNNKVAYYKSDDVQAFSNYIIYEDFKYYNYSDLDDWPDEEHYSQSIDKIMHRMIDYYSVNQEQYEIMKYLDEHMVEFLNVKSVDEFKKFINLINNFFIAGNINIEYILLTNIDDINDYFKKNYTYEEFIEKFDELFNK